MGLQKGSTNNPKGRPKGRPNKTTGPMRSRITQFLSENFDTIMHDLKSLNQRDRVKAYTDMLQYGLPKLQAIALKAEIDEPYNENKVRPATGSDINIMDLPPELKNPLLSYLKRNGKEAITLFDDIDYSKLSTETLKEIVSFRDRKVNS